MKQQGFDGFYNKWRQLDVAKYHVMIDIGGFLLRNERLFNGYSSAF